MIAYLKAYGKDVVAGVVEPDKNSVLCNKDITLDGSASIQKVLDNGYKKVDGAAPAPKKAPAAPKAAPAPAPAPTPAQHSVVSPVTTSAQISRPMRNFAEFEEVKRTPAYQAHKRVLTVATKVYSVDSINEEKSTTEEKMPDLFQVVESKTE